MTGTHPNIKRQENLLDYNEGGELKTMGETKSIAEFSTSESISLKAVSYTHLTLPTICSV